jgi:hypothetical protein
MKKIVTTAIAAALIIGVPAVSFAGYDDWARDKIERANAKAFKYMEWNAKALKKGYYGDDPYYSRLKYQYINGKIRGHLKEKKAYIYDRCKGRCRGLGVDNPDPDGIGIGNGWR